MSKRASDASERANGGANGPVLYVLISYHLNPLCHEPANKVNNPRLGKREQVIKRSIAEHANERSDQAAWCVLFNEQIEWRRAVIGEREGGDSTRFALSNSFFLSLSLGGMK